MTLARHLAAITLLLAIGVPAVAAMQAGDYTFSINCGGRAMLFVQDIRGIEDLQNVSGGRLQGRVRLQAGWHPLRLYYRPGSGKPRFEFQLATSDGKPLALNAWSFCRFESQD